MFGTVSVTRNRVRATSAEPNCRACQCLRCAGTEQAEAFPTFAGPRQLRFPFQALSFVRAQDWLRSTRLNRKTKSIQHYVSYGPSSRFKFRAHSRRATDPAIEELSQRLLGPDEERGEDMWRFCKELNGTKSLNERDYFPHSEIMSVDLRYVL